MPALKNRLRILGFSSSRSVLMSSLRSFTSIRRPRCQSFSIFTSISNRKISASKSFDRANRTFLALDGSTPARALSSTTKRIFSHKIHQLCGNNKVFGTERMKLSTTSAFVPYLQRISHYFNLPNSNNKTNRIVEITSLATRTNNVKHVTEARAMDKKFIPYASHSFSSLPSKSFLTQHRFRIMLQDSGLFPGQSISVASIGTTRSYSSSTRVSINRFALSPRMIRVQAAQPSARHKVLFRNSSSGGKGKKNEKEILAESNKSKDSSPSSDSVKNSDHNKIQEFMDSTVSTVRTNVGSAEATIKRAVEELSTGDLLSVYGIVLFIVVIAVGPSMIRRMQSSDGDSSYNVIDPEDPVMDLARMIRGEYLESIKRSKGSEQDEAEETAEDDKERTHGRQSALGLDRIVADLLKSPQIEQAVITLVTKIIQSPQFKTACQLLLKELLKDLLDDPDTLKQVIHLLQNSIKDEKIKEAAIQLATDIFGDDRVLDELVTLVQRLGMEQQVKFATQALLVESAHNALNDPEILDHSMEFATDVVGDDVVQQTAGEALYNTMSYAFRPTLSVGKYFVLCTFYTNLNLSV